MCWPRSPASRCDRSSELGTRAYGRSRLSTAAPLFLLLFAAAYHLMAQTDAGNFNVHTLTRTDALYFTVTVFATVGFGEMNPTSQAAPVPVMVQMILDLILLGLGIRVFTSAVQVGRQGPDSSSPAAPAVSTATGDDSS